MADDRTYVPKPLEWHRLPEEEMRARARAFHELMARRRSVRDFSTEPVPVEVIEQAIATAGSAPSGANQQPWSFVLVSDPKLKRRMREAAEAEERESYDHRMAGEWLAAVGPLGTDWHKPHITDAPHVIVVFEQAYGLRAAPDRHGGAQVRVKHYYVQESVGIAVGFLLVALHQAGLVTLPHTPSPMKFLTDQLGRPENERAFMLIPVGYPADGATVPDLTRKPLDEILNRR